MSLSNAPDEVTEDDKERNKEKRMQRRQKIREDFGGRIIEPDRIITHEAKGEVRYG